MRTLQEVLQERAEHIDAMDALIQAAVENEDGDLTGAQLAEYDQHKAAVEALDEEKAKIEARDERIRQTAGLKAGLDEPAGNRAPRPSALYGANTQPDKLDDKGFSSLGELVHALRFGDPKGRIHNLAESQGQESGREVPDAFKAQVMPRFRNEWTMGTGGEGGFAIGTQFDPEIRWIRPEQAVVRPRAAVIPPGDPPDSEITMPALVQGTAGALGGVVVTHLAEGGAKPETDANLREVALKPHEVAAHTVVTDKTLRNWAASNTFISMLLQMAVQTTEDADYLRGNGVGKPHGVIGSAGAKAVNRGTASEIQFDDINSMLADMLPDAMPGAVWVANQSTMPQIAALKDSNGNSIFIQGNITAGLPMTLYGSPILFTGRTPALGTKGDLILANFSFYLIKDGSGPFIDASPHVHFTSNKTVVKVTFNYDGKTWVDQPLMLGEGQVSGAPTVSPFVILDVPAS